MCGIDLKKAKSLLDELQLLDKAAKINTTGRPDYIIVADGKELNSLDSNLVLGWLTRGTTCLSGVGRKELRATIREIELIID